MSASVYCCRFYFGVPGATHLQYVGPHHKTAKGDETKQQGPWPVDADWGQVGVMHVQSGHSTLLRHSRGPNTPTLESAPHMIDIRFMFIDTNTGGGFSYSSFRTWFTTLLLRRTGVSFTPHFMRNIWVTWLKQLSPEIAARQENMFHNAIAHVMGNSVPQWDRSYYQVSLQAQGLAALQLLPQWRLDITKEIREARQAALQADVQPMVAENIIAEQQECSVGAGVPAPEPQVAAEVFAEVPHPAQVAAPSPNARWWAWAWFW